MQNAVLYLKDESATVLLGEYIGKNASCGDLLVLTGDLGTGKTTLVKGVAKGLGIDHHWVTSPTFTIIKEYQGRIPLIHIDIYRLPDPDEFIYIGGLEYIESGDNLTVIEWGEGLLDILPKTWVQIKLSHKTGCTGRSVEFYCFEDGRYKWLEEAVLKWKEAKE